MIDARMTRAARELSGDRWRRAAEALAIAVAAALWLALGARVLRGASLTASLALGAPLALAAGVLASDLLSGLVHFACDRFGDERTPLIGRTFIAPFREHHRDPRAIARHGFCERNGNNALALLPALGLAHAAQPAVLLGVFLLALFFALGITNEVHAWAHGRAAPRLVRRLQRAGLLLSPAAHRLHHQHDHARAYCITTGWLNPALDRAGFWHAIERTVRGVKSRWGTPG